LKDEFLATLSHELRTPLNAIMGWAHVLGQSSHDRDTVQRASTVIKQNAASQSQLIDDILDVSRIVGGRLVLDTQLVDLHNVIDDAIDSLMPAASAKVIHVTRESGQDDQGHRRSGSLAADRVESRVECAQVHAEGRPCRGWPHGR
jgi:signal transduction histidine kinase